MLHIYVLLFWHPFDPKLQGLRLTYILQVKKRELCLRVCKIWFPVPWADLAQMLEWKYMSLECDSLQNKR